MPTKPQYAGHARKPLSHVRREYAARSATSPEKAAAVALRNSGAWAELRRNFAAAHPVCGICRSELTQQVHHLAPVEKRPDLALDWDNLAPVCTRCHGQCNSLERRGETTGHLFAGFVRRPQF